MNKKNWVKTNLPRIDLHKSPSCFSSIYVCCVYFGNLYLFIFNFFAAFFFYFSTLKNVHTNSSFHTKHWGNPFLMVDCPLHIFWYIGPNYSWMAFTLKWLSHLSVGSFFCSWGLYSQLSLLRRLIQNSSVKSQFNLFNQSYASKK